MKNYFLGELIPPFHLSGISVEIPRAIPDIFSTFFKYCFRHSCWVPIRNFYWSSTADSSFGKSRGISPRFYRGMLPKITRISPEFSIDIPSEVLEVVPGGISPRIHPIIYSS